MSLLELFCAVDDFWKTFEPHLVQFPTRNAARAVVFEFIEVFYNRQRLHSSLDYCSPVQF